MTTLTPEHFVAKWKRATARERQAAQSHFLDLCALVGHPSPIDFDPTGKEFQNVIYFNLSKTETGSKAEHLEEERRVAYVAATRPKDDLLITFSSAKPSIFLKELSLNPKYEQLKKDELSRNHAALLRSLERGKAVLRGIETAKEKAVAKFDELIKFEEKRFPSWLVPMIWAFHNQRIHRAQKAITKIELRLKNHTDNVIQPLLVEIDEMNEEIKLRVNLGAN